NCPPPNGIRSPSFARRRSRSRSGRGGTRPRPHSGRARCCRGSRSPASPFVGRGGRAPPSARRPAPASARGVSFDDLVGAAKDRLRNGQPQRLGSLEVDDQLEFGRLLDRQVGRLGAGENPPRISANLAPNGRLARSITDQSAELGGLTPLIDRRNGKPRCQCNKLITPAVEERIAADNERT